MNILDLLTEVVSLRDARHIDKTFYLGSSKLFYEFNYDSYVPQSELLDILNANLGNDLQNWKIQRNGVWTHVVPLLKDGLARKLPQVGWKIHLSATLENCQEILTKAIEILIRRRISFKFANDSQTLRMMTSKRWPRGGSGKFVTIYPIDDQTFKDVIEELYNSLKNCSGSYILSDRRYKDCKCIYYRYGAFISKKVFDITGRAVEVVVTPNGSLQLDRRNPFYDTPEWVEEIFDMDEFEAADSAEEATLGEGKYKILKALTFSNTGGVYLAIQKNNGREVIIKEARPGVELGIFGHDATDLLRHEANILKIMEGSDVSPSLIDLFIDWENLYLVEEYIEAVNLREMMLKHSPLIKSSNSYSNSHEFFSMYKSVFLSVLACVSEFHRKGIAVGDLSPMNVLVHPTTLKVTIIDLEGATSDEIGVIQDIYTPGYRPHTQEKKENSSFFDDYYAIASMMMYCIFPISAMGYLRENLFTDVLPSLLNDINWRGIGLDSLILSLSRGETNCESAIERLREIRLEPKNLLKKVSKKSTFDISNSITEMERFILNSYRPDRKTSAFPIDPFGKVTNQHSLFYGTAGVLWSILVSSQRIPPEMLDRFFNDLDGMDKSTLAVGLATGAAGIAFALLEFGTNSRALPYLDILLAVDLRECHHSLYYGSAGIGLVCIQAWYIFKEEKYRLRVLEILLFLESRAQVSAEGVFWRDAGGIRLGMGYGQAGVALFLLRASEMLGDNKWKDLGRKALEYDLAHGIELETGVVSLPGERDPDATLQTASPYIEQGSAGVAKVAIRYGMFDEIQGLLKATHRKYTGFPGLIFGLAGLADALIDMSIYSSDDRYRDMAALPIEGLKEVYLFRNIHGLAVPGENLFRVSCDYATGVSGVMLTLFRYRERAGDRLLLDWISASSAN